MKKAIITIMIIMLLLNTLPLVIAAEESTTKVDLTEIQIKTLYLQEEAKTRAEIKQYFANQRILLEKDLQKSIDENFQVLDKRQDTFLREASFKLGITFFSGLIAGMLVVMLIWRKITKKTIIKPNVEDKRHQEAMMIPIPVQEEDYNPQSIPVRLPEENLLQKTPTTNIISTIPITPSMKESENNG